MLIPTLPRGLAEQLRDTEERADKVFEAVVALVTDNKDPEKLGRVKVTYPTLPGDDTSWWAPISSLGAGKDRGWYFLPEIDDEVLVMFEHGDIQRPVVIGALWNGKDKPPDKNDGGNERRVLHSRDGNKVVFDDDTDVIIFKDGGGVGTIELSGGGIKITASSGDVNLQSPSGDCIMVAGGDIKLNANGTVTISTGKDLKITGDSNVEFSSGGNIMADAPTLDINGGGAPKAQKKTDKSKSIPDPIG